ncbi:MAG: hypothetical protein ACRD2K_02225 [Terriglobales bacterium]
MAVDPIMLLFSPLALLGIVVGGRALVDVRRSQGALVGRKKAVAGILINILALASLPYTWQMGRTKSPHRISESSAVGSLRSIMTAEATYQNTYPKAGFSADLKSLGGERPYQPGPATCRPSPAHACLLEDALAGAGVKSGFRFTYSAADTDHDGALDAFTVQADTIENLPARHFFVDQTGVIRYDLGHPATAASPPLQ